MKQISNAETELSQYDQELGNKDGRMFNYVMNNKRAKAKLLKGAKRGKHLVIESRNGCVNLIFSDGSYVETVLPLLRSWHQKLNERIKMNGAEIEIIEMDDGFDDTQKHIDTKLVIMSNSCRLVLHAYNSKQKLMVQGQNYENFTMNILEPFFQEKIEETIEKITKLNDDIKNSLENKNQHKIEKTFNCPQCGVIFCSNGELKVHIKSCHTRPSLNSPQQNKVPKILQEDISFSILDENPILAVENETPRSQGCVCQLCGHASTDEKNLRDHTEEKHGKVSLEAENDINKNNKEKEPEILVKHPEEELSKDEKLISENKLEVVALFICEECGFYANSVDDLIEHQQDVHGQSHGRLGEEINEENHEKELSHDVKLVCENNIVEVEALLICEKCGFHVNGMDDLKQHQDNAHCQEKTDDIQLIKSETCSKCSKCNYVGTQTELRNHMSTKHENEFFKCTRCEQVYKDTESLNNHIRSTHEISAEPFPCNICGLVLATFDLLQNHMISFHTPTIGVCKYCEHRTNSEEDLKEHMLEDHEDILLLHTMASQVDSIENKVNSFDGFKQEVMGLLAKLFSSHNEIKQELFLVRNNQVHEKSEPVSNAGKHFDANKVADAPRKSYKDAVESNIEYIRKETDKHEERSVEKAEKVLWFGSSLSKSLDIHKFQRDTKTRVKNVKAYGIKKEENQLVPEMNFTDIVPDIMKDEDPDTIVLEGGSIEISNIDVKGALMDEDRDIEDYKKEWFHKVGEDSENMFGVAEKAIKQKPNLKIIIVKRLPRHDPYSVDPLGIKKKISKFGNDAYDQMWFQRGCPKNIHIVDFELGSENSPHLKKLIFGNPDLNAFDGIHLRGQGASRHLTYRAVQAIKPVLKTKAVPLSSHKRFSQAMSQKQQHDKQQAQMYRNKVGSQKVIYNIPTQNSFDVLGNY